MKSINNVLFDFVLNRPKLLDFLLKNTTFAQFPSLQKVRNRFIALAIEGIYSAGDDLKSAMNHLGLLEKRNTCAILNYAIEAAGDSGIALMRSEYNSILHALEDRRFPHCVALKPTALIKPSKIIELSKFMTNIHYPQENFDALIHESGTIETAKPLADLIASALEKDVRILIDAEQSDLQPGVDLLAIYLMEKFNKNGCGTVYNTYQLYLQDSPKRLFSHKLYLKQKGAKFAGKLVRGAYLTYETLMRDKSHLNYRICSSKSEVDRNYDLTAQALLSDDGSDLIIATHNINSIKSALQNIRHGSRNNIEFAYLMGFGDKLAKYIEDQKRLEYVPYGPTDVKIPYLIRRLEENVSIFAPK